MHKPALSLASLALCMALPAQAEPRVETDFVYFYDMRETQPHRDGDITFLSMALSTHRQGRIRRSEFGLGVRNEFWGDAYPPAAYALLSESHDRGGYRQGIGLRIIAAADEWSALDIGQAASLSTGQTDLRLYYGLQFLSSDSYFETGRAVSGFVQGEASHWLTPNVAIRVGIGRDDGSTIAGLATALAHPNWPLSLEAEYSIGAPEYRGDPEHSDLWVGLRWLGLNGLQGDTLRARETRQDSRLFDRPTEPN